MPYVLAIVELDEGPRLLTNVIGIEPAEVTVDLRVTARFAEDEDAPLVQFEPAVS